MNRFQTFQEFLATQSVPISFTEFFLNIFLSAGLAFLLGSIYIKYGTCLSNRRMFAKNFVPMTMTTMLVITIVKSSLALSLGLVGALSIVRFRAAIKEPEEIVYLFLAIAIGLGFGANQGTITIAAFAAISGVIALRNVRRDPDQTQNLWLTVSSHAPQEVTLEQMIEIFKKNSVTADIKRFDETKDVIEASFLIECDNFGQLSKAKLALQKLNDSIKVTFLDNQGIL